MVSSYITIGTVHSEGLHCSLKGSRGEGEGAGGGLGVAAAIRTRESRISSMRSYSFMYVVVALLQGRIGK